MAITKVQQATGNGATVALTSVAAGNLLTLHDSYFRAVSTGSSQGAPTDTQGTWSVAQAGVPGIEVPLGYDCGSGIFYQANVAAGTHTVTPQSTFAHNATLAEWSGVATSTPFDVGANAKTNNSSFTSQVMASAISLTGKTPRLALRIFLMGVFSLAQKFMTCII